MSNITFSELSFCSSLFPQIISHTVLSVSVNGKFIFPTVQDKNFEELLLFLSYLTSNISDNSTGHGFKIDPESSHFLIYFLPGPCPKPPGSLPWVILIANSLISFLLPLLLLYSLPIMILLKNKTDHATFLFRMAPCLRWHCT